MQVSIKYVNFPKPGGKYGSIKLTDGNMIMVPPDLLGQFRAGMTCEIATKQQTWGNGPEARQVIIATSGPQAGQNPGYQGQGGQPGWQGPTAGTAPYRHNTGFQPRVVQGGGGPPSARTADQDRLIFVTGVVGRAMGSGKFTASEIGVLAGEANAAFERLRNPPRPAPAPVTQTQYEPLQGPDTGPVGPSEEPG